MADALINGRRGAAGAAALARVEGLQGLHGLVERIAQLHDGPARNKDGVTLRVAALLDLEVRAGVVFLHVHINPLATRLEARREDLLVVHGRFLDVATVLSSLRALKSGFGSRLRPGAQKFKRGWLVATARLAEAPFLAEQDELSDYARKKLASAIKDTSDVSGSQSSACLPHLSSAQLGAFESWQISHIN